MFLSGHSLLDKPIPEYIDLIARSHNDDYNYEEQNLFGSTIAARTLGAAPVDRRSFSPTPSWDGYRKGRNRQGENMDVIAELRAPRRLGAGERYDTLLITERHDIPWSASRESTAAMLRHYHDRLIEGNPEAQTLFVHVWLQIDKDNPEPWLDYERKALAAWECVASKVNLTLAADKRADRVRPAPGGAALVDLVERALAGQVRGVTGSPRQRLDAIFSDDVHLTKLGAYFMAAVHYSSIFGKSSRGAGAPAGIAAETAGDLHRIAWNHVREYGLRPGAGSRAMDECRAVVARDVCPGFWKIASHAGTAGRFAAGLRARIDAYRKTRSCQATFLDASADDNPFRWPDATAPWPAPPG